MGGYGIITVAVTPLDFSIQAVNYKLGALIPADLPSGIFGLFLRVEVSAAPTGTSSFDVPATVGVVDNMM